MANILISERRLPIKKVMYEYLFYTFRCVPAKPSCKTLIYVWVTPFNYVLLIWGYNPFNCNFLRLCLPNKYLENGVDGWYLSLLRWISTFLSMRSEK